MPRRNKSKHGHNRGPGLKTPTYGSWAAMMQRCFNPNHEKFPTYGGRGITVCNRWRDFTNFLADMGERPEGMTLDRIEDHLCYEPGNCRWATPAVQQRKRAATKLTEEIVAEIRASTETNAVVAERYGITLQHVSGIRNYRYWRD